MVATCRRLIAAALVIVVSASCSTEPSTDGPLLLDDGHESESGMPVDVGTVVTFGHNIARHDGRQSVKVQEAVLVPDGDVTGATVEGVYVVDMDRLPGGGVGLARGFPPRQIPRNLLSEAAGMVLEPGRGEEKPDYGFLFAVRVTKPGKWRFSGAKIRYTVDGDSYSVTSHSGLQLCAPAKATCKPSKKSAGK